MLGVVGDREALKVAAARVNPGLVAALQGSGLNAREVRLTVGTLVDQINGFVLAEATGVLASAGTAADEAFEFGISAIMEGATLLLEPRRRK